MLTDLDQFLLTSQSVSKPIQLVSKVSRLHKVMYSMNACGVSSLSIDNSFLFFNPFSVDNSFLFFNPYFGHEET